MALWLSACAGLGPRDKPDDPEAAWADLRAELEALAAWRADGRMSVRMDNDGGTAGFVWHERGGDRFALRLAGPWGQGVARLNAEDGRVRLDEGGDRVLRGRDAATLLQRAYGWDVPVAQLRRWLIGLPTADLDADDYTLDDFGRLATLEWQDWEIEYRSFRQAEGIDLPADLVATRPGEDVRIRVRIDEWRLREPEDAEDGEAGDNGSGVPLIGD